MGSKNKHTGDAVLDAFADDSGGTATATQDPVLSAFADDTPQQAQPQVQQTASEPQQDGLKKNTPTPSLATLFLQGKVTGNPQEGISVKQDDGTIATDHPTKGKFVETPKQYQQRTSQENTDNAISYIAKDVTDNAHLQSPEVQDNINTVHFHQPESIVKNLTNPAGDPQTTAAYLKDRLAQLQMQKAQEMSNTWENHDRVNAKYDQQAADLQHAAGSLLALQLFNQETQKTIPAAESATRINTLQKERDAEIQAANTQLHDKVQGEDKYNVDKANSEFQDQVRQINQNFNAQREQVANNSKFNPILLGAQSAALLQAPNAEQDLEKLKLGQPIDAQRQYQYNLAGNHIIQQGAHNTINEQAQKEGEAHADWNGDQLVENNKPFLLQQARQTIGNAKYRDENLFLHALVPSAFLSDITEKEVRDYAKAEDVDPRLVGDLASHPEDIPKSVSVWQQLAKGASSGSASLYERGIRTAAAISGNSSDLIDDRFKPGWEDQSGITALMAGNMPTEQNRVRNVRGFVGRMAESVGELSVIFSEVGGVEKLFEGLGAAKASEKLANFGIMAFNGYNDAYHNSKEIIGDKPEDEGKRQLYSIVSGLSQGLIFSISPPSKLIKNALGEMAKSGEELINEIKKNGIEALQQPDFKEKWAKYITAIAKDNGVQVSLASANKIAENGINMIADKKNKHDLSEGVGDAAVSTAISMALPSIFSGIGHERMQTPLNEAAVFEIGTNPQKYTDHVMQMRNDGKISDAQEKRLLDNIQTINNVVQAAPIHNQGGENLTPDGIKKYSFNLLQENILQKQADQIKATAEKSGTQPDKARLAPITSAISDLQKQRGEILDNAKTIEEPDQERSVATKTGSEQQPSTKKVNENPEDVLDDYYSYEENIIKGFYKKNKELTESDKKDLKNIKENPEEQLNSGIDYFTNKLNAAKSENDSKDIKYYTRKLNELSSFKYRLDIAKESAEKIAQEEKNNLSLNPEKLVENEKSNDDQSGRNKRKSSNKRKGSETQPQRNENGEIRDESEQDRQLNPTETESSATEDKTPVDSLFSKLDEVAKKLGPVKEPEPEQKQEAPKEKTYSPFAAIDLGDFEGRKKTKTLDHAIKSTPIDQPFGVKEKGETFKNAVDRTKQDWENLKATADKNTVQIAHSGLLKIVNAVEHEGISWDDYEGLKKAYNKETESPAGELIHFKADNGDQFSVVRHGESADNAENKIRTKDSPLTDKGQQQAKEIAQKLKEAGIEDPNINSSDLVRGKQTKEIIDNELKLPQDANEKIQTGHQENNPQASGVQPEGVKNEPGANEPAKKNGDSNSKRDGQAQETVIKKPRRKPQDRTEEKEIKADWDNRKKNTLSRDPQTLKEAVLQFILRRNRVSKDFFDRFLGYKGDDAKPYLRRYSKDGVKPDQFIHELSSGSQNHLVHDEVDGLNEFADIFTEYGHQNENQITEALEKLQNEDPYAGAEPAHGWDFTQEAQHISDIPQENLDIWHDDTKEIGKYEEGLSHIENMDLSNEEANNIISYLSALQGEDGKLDASKVDPISDEYQSVFKNLESEGAKKVFDLVVESDSDKVTKLLDHLKEFYGHPEAAPENEPGRTEIPAGESQSATGGNVAAKVSEPGGSQPRENPVANRAPGRIAEIDLQLQKEKASQHIEATKRDAAEKAGDVEEANKHNANWYKKQEKIDKLNEERDQLSRAQQQEEISTEKEDLQYTIDLHKQQMEQAKETLAHLDQQYGEAEPEEQSDIADQIADEKHRFENAQRHKEKAEADLKKLENKDRKISVAEYVRGFKIAEHEATPEAGPRIQKSGLFDPETISRIGIKILNAGLEKAARAIEAGESIRQAIMRMINHINDHAIHEGKELTTDEEDKIKDELHFNDPHVNTLTPEDLRNQKQQRQELHEIAKNWADEAVQHIKDNKHTLKDVLKRIKEVPLADSDKQKLREYLTQKVNDEIFRAKGEEIGKEFLAQSGNDYDEALKNIKKEFEDQILEAGTQTEQQNLKNKQAAAEAWLEIEHAKEKVAEGEIKPDYIHEPTPVDPNKFVPQKTKRSSSTYINTVDKLAAGEEAVQTPGAKTREGENFVTAFRLAKSKAKHEIERVQQFLGMGTERTGSFFDRLRKEAGSEGLNQLGLFMYAEHAPERNEQNRIDRENLFTAKVNELKQKLANAKSDEVTARLQEQLDDILSQKDKRYQLMPDGGSGMTNEQAKEIMDEAEQDGKREIYERFAKEFRDNVTVPHLEMMHESQLISDEEFDKLKDHYQYYVPLRVKDEVYNGKDELRDGDEPLLIHEKWKELKEWAEKRFSKVKETDADKTFAETGRNGRGLYRSKGAAQYTFLDRNNPILQAEHAYETMARKAEQNKADIAFAHFWTDNPNSDLVDIKSPEYDILRDKEGNVLHVEEDLAKRPKNAFDYYVGGKKQYLVVKDPGLRKMFTKMGRYLLVDIGNKLSSWTRLVNTMRSPYFIVRNVFRDVQDAQLNIGVTDAKEGKYIGKTYRKNLLNAIKGIGGAIADKAAGRESEWVKEWQGWEDDWKKHGGQISFYNPENFIKRVTETNKQFEHYGQLTGKKAATYVFRQLEHVGTFLENSTRVQVYRAAVEGMARQISEEKNIPIEDAMNEVDREKAALVSRNATVDFERKGFYGAAINAFKPFVNAGIQGNLNIAYGIAKYPKMAAKVLGGLVALGMVQNELNRAFSDCKDVTNPDCYGQVDENMKEKNFVIPNKMFGGHGFSYVPGPFNFGWFNYFGVKADEFIHKDIGAGEFAAKAMSSSLDYFDPTGGSDEPIAQKATGNLSPIPAIGLNQTPFGSPMHPEHQTGVFPSDAYFPSTPQAFVETAHMIAKISGQEKDQPGKIEIYPNILQYLYTQATGGIGKFTQDVYNTARHEKEGTPLKTNETPFLNIFEHTSNLRPLKEEYFSLLGKFDKGTVKQEDMPNVANRMEEINNILLSNGDISPVQAAFRMQKVQKFMQADIKQEVNREVKENEGDSK